MKKIYQNITINQEQNAIADKKLLTIYLNQQFTYLIFFRLIKLNRFYYTSLGYVKK